MPDDDDENGGGGGETERRGRRRRQPREEEVEVERPRVLDKPKSECRYRAMTDLRKRCVAHFTAILHHYAMYKKLKAICLSDPDQFILESDLAIQLFGQ